MKSKYIRFFISSTFADMAKERDLLQKLFIRLSNEYAQKGWQIEAVDLRWGISMEAGFDNRTMQICRNEIKRCQQLSPKPNFIALLGNRYGWTPLPETIPFKVSMLLKMSATEKELFNRWYRLDENALPEGEYILQKREGRYRDAVIWFDDVEYPLSKMFIRNAKHIKWKLWELKHKSKSPVSRLFGESATAQEIHLGVFCVSDSNEHVIAYLRDITDVPESDISTFCESGELPKQRLTRLKEQLETTLNACNILKVKESFGQYTSTHFSNMFTLEMEKRIRRVIDQAISEYEATEATTEDEIHLAIAAEEARNFVGRRKELAEISQYINDPNEHRPLWIKSESGSGKSALMAKVIQNHLHTHHIICRFCGRSSGTLTTEDLSFIAKSWKRKDFLKTLTKPTLIILDALNQLDDKNDLQFASLNWLKEVFPSNIKIIISTTNELKYSQTPDFLKIYELSNMGEDSGALVMNILKQSERRLTPDQEVALNKIIEVSNHSALYLHILGHYLRHATSWDYIDDTPSNLEGLINVMIGELTQPERHGAPLVIEALSFMIIDKMGITDKEMIDLLSENNNIRRALENSSFHPLDTQELEWRIPSVLWSRLRYDLSPFLRTYTSQAGQMTTIYHNELKQILFNLCLNKPAFVAETASHLFHYYKAQIHTNNTHALLEIIHSTIDNNTMERGQSYIDEAADFLCSDLDFLLTKHRLFPQQLIDDFNIILPYFDGEKRNKISVLKRSISSLPKYASNEQLLLYMHGLPTNSILHQLALEKVDKTHVMTNLLADSGFEDSTIYTLSEIGEIPCMSDDGSKVASLFENRRNIRIADLIHPEKGISLNATAEVLELQCDDEMKYLAIRMDNTCLVFDIEHNNTIFSHYIGERGWMSISADGQTFALGDIGMVQAFRLNAENKQYNLIFNYNFPKNDALCGRIDYTGQYLWLLFTNKDLFCYDINSKDNYRGWPLQFYEFDSKGEKELQILSALDCGIISCTKDWCICYHHYYYVIHTNECFWGSKEYENTLMAISRQENQLLVHGGRWQDEYCHIYYINKEKQKPKFETIGHALMRGLKQINSNFTIGLNAIEHRVFDISVQLKHYAFPYDNYGGINSLTCTSDGNLCVISYGKNIGMEHKKDITIIENKHAVSWIPPFKNEDYKFASCSRLSSNRKFIVIGNTVNEKKAELLFYSIRRNEIIKQIQTDKEQCTGLYISPDEKYIVATFNEHWKPDSGLLFTFNNKGNLLFNVSIKDGIFENWLFVSNNNQFSLVISKNGGIRDDLKTGTFVPGKYNVIDNLNPTHLLTNIPIHLYAIFYSCDIPLFAISPQGKIYTNDIYNVELTIYSPNSKTIEKISCDKFVVGIAPSGRILYFIDKNHTLYLARLPLDGHFEKLLKKIQFIIPAYDEAHIYAINDEFTIILFNIETHIIEQVAFCGKTNYQQTCSKGLYTFSCEGDVFLFQPDDKYHVNVPAITTFVRRWNLETKKQEEPTAVCPMCGHQFRLPEEMVSVITDLPSEINYADWGNPQLKGHLCPHCRAQLQFNPYIT